MLPAGPAQHLQHVPVCCSSYGQGQRASTTTTCRLARPFRRLRWQLW